MRSPLNRWLGDLPREVAVLTAVAFAVAVGFGIVIPALPLFARDFGVSNLAAGFVISVFALMRFVSSPFAGTLVNRLGERVVLASGIGIVAVSSALAGLAQSYGQLVVLRGFGGVGSSMFTVAASALLLRVVEPHQRGRATGAWQGGFLLGGILGPAFGGFFTDISLRLPFFLYAGTLVVAGSIGMVFLSHSRLRAREEQVGTTQAPTPLRVAVRSSAYRAAVVNNFTTGWSLFGLRASLLPLFVVEGLRLSAGWVGLGLLISGVSQGLLLIPAGRFADERGRKPPLVAGGVLIAASFLLITFWETTPTYLAAMVVFGVGSAFLGTSSQAIVGDVIGGRGGTPIAAFQMAADLGAFLGPIAGGYLADVGDFSWAFGMSAGLVVVGVVLAAAMPETLAGARSGRQPPDPVGGPPP